MTATVPDLLVVANAAAGARDRPRIEAAAGRLAASAPTRLVWTSSPDDLDDLVDGIGGERLVIAGGDGSVHAVVNALDRSDRFDVEVAVVPFGTGNDLVGGLGLGDVDDALAAAVGPGIRRLDLLRSADAVTVNALHLGLGADAAALAARWKPRLGPAAYPLGAGVAGVTDRGFTARISLDDEPPVSGRFAMVAVANGWRIGGGFPLAPAASPADGRLEVVLVESTGVRGRVALAVAGRRGAHGTLDGVESRHAERVVIEPDGEVGCNRDGELGTVGRLEVSVDPARLLVCAPGEGRPSR